VKLVNSLKLLFNKSLKKKVEQFLISFFEILDSSCFSQSTQSEENDPFFMEEEFVSNESKITPNKSMVKQIVAALENDSPNLRSILEFFVL